MNLRKTLKSMVLAGMTFVAGLGTYHFAQSKGENTSDNTKAKTYERSTVSTQKRETYEIRAGVLMPKAGESQESYEKRRVRLEKEENRLKEVLAENIRRQLAEAHSKKRSSFVINALEDRLEEHEKKACYISFYTPEGQTRLKGLNRGQSSSRAPVSNGNVRQGRTYDF